MATLTVHRCSCGKRCSRYSDRCQSCHRARIAECVATAQRIVARGTCPDCGTKLVRNSSIAGWWQCGASATESHRKPEFAGLPTCHFQAFTE